MAKEKKCGPGVAGCVLVREYWRKKAAKKQAPAKKQPRIAKVVGVSKDGPIKRRAAGKGEAEKRGVEKRGAKTAKTDQSEPKHFALTRKGKTPVDPVFGQGKAFFVYQDGIGRGSVFRVTHRGTGLMVSAGKRALAESITKALNSDPSLDEIAHKVAKNRASVDEANQLRAVIYGPSSKEREEEAKKESEKAASRAAKRQRDAEKRKEGVFERNSTGNYLLDFDDDRFHLDGLIDRDGDVWRLLLKPKDGVFPSSRDEIGSFKSLKAAKAAAKEAWSFYRGSGDWPPPKKATWPAAAKFRRGEHVRAGRAFTLDGGRADEYTGRLFTVVEASADGSEYGLVEGVVANVEGLTGDHYLAENRLRRARRGRSKA